MTHTANTSNLRGQRSFGTYVLLLPFTCCHGNVLLLSWWMKVPKMDRPSSVMVQTLFADTCRSSLGLNTYARGNSRPVLYKIHMHDVTRNDSLLSGEMEWFCRDGSLKTHPCFHFSKGVSHMQQSYTTYSFMDVPSLFFDADKEQQATIILYSKQCWKLKHLLKSMEHFLLTSG